MTTCRVSYCDRPVADPEPGGRPDWIETETVRPTPPWEPDEEASV